MIKVTRLNGEEFYVNSDLIEFIEKTPDTVLTLTTGRKIVVKEDIPEIIKRITVFRGTLVRASLNLEENAEPEVDGKQELEKDQDEV
ncbi:MAG: flagellar FlbD family protein [Firmicutes bacterium]|nr:flagellar FlbD family protein [Bacillota bacterium]